MRQALVPVISSVHEMALWNKHVLKHTNLLETRLSIQIVVLVTIFATSLSSAVHATCPEQREGSCKLVDRPSAVFFNLQHCSFIVSV